MKNKFQRDDKVRAIKLQSLRKEFENMRMKDSESMAKYSTRFLELVNQMKTHGEDISDQKIIDNILISVPEKFNPLVAVIEHTQDSSSMPSLKLFASLKSYEQRLS